MRTSREGVKNLGIRILVVALLLIAAPAHAKTFKIATVSPDGLSWMKQLRTGANEIKDRTDGRVEFKIYPGGVQGDDFTVLRKMRIGQLQGGVVASSSLTRFYPDLQIYSLPLSFHNHDEVDYVRARMDQRIASGLDSAGLVSFSFVETGFAYLLTTKPVTTLPELRNMKSWVPDGDPVAARLIRSFGVSPIPLHLTDVLAGLQTGMVDAIMVPPIVALALQWHNHVNYLMDEPLLYTYTIMMLDKKAFAAVSEPDQEIVREVMDRVFMAVDKENRKDNQAAFKALVNQGIEVVEPRAEELVSWRAQAETSINALVEAKEISAESVKLLDQYLTEARSGKAQPSPGE